MFVLNWISKQRLFNIFRSSFLKFLHQILLGALFTDSSDTHKGGNDDNRQQNMACIGSL